MISQGTVLGILRLSEPMYLRMWIREIKSWFGELFEITEDQ